MDKIKNFINQINGIVAKNKTIEKLRSERGELFNIFEVCGVNHYELLHSSIIAEFLNPKGSHGQGALFLKAFFDVINDRCQNIDKFAIDDVSVETEKTFDNGRIDISISNSKKQIVIIENKIYANDQCEQLKRYEKYAKDNCREYYILYLSLDGHESNEATKDAVKYSPISYSIEIVDWLIKCKELSIDKPIIRETLSQYIFHIKKLTRTEDDMNAENKNELLNILIENKNATIQILKSERDLIEKIIVEHIVEELKDLAKEIDCKFYVDKDFNQRIKNCLWNSRSYPGFWFENKNGLKVRFEAQSSGLSDFIGGLPNDYNPQLTTQRIGCFNKDSDTWSAGYNFLLDKYCNWDLETLFSIKENMSDFRKYIKDYLEMVFNSMNEINTAEE